MGGVYYRGSLDLEEARRACETRLKHTRERSKKPRLFEYWDEIIETGQARVHVILGQPGAGKSTLALLFLMHRFECDIEEIMDRIVWKPDVFLEKFEAGRDVLVWDDAGVWYRLLAKAHWDPLSVTLTTIYDLGRLHVPLVIMTMVTDRDLPRGLRYNSMVYRSRTRVWRAGLDSDHGVARAVAVTQVRREKQDWSQSYWDAQSELVYKFYLFKENDPFYSLYYTMREQYGRHFIQFAKSRLSKSKLYELLRSSSEGS